jgi:hypothetical protein
MCFSNPVFKTALLPYQTGQAILQLMFPGFQANAICKSAKRRAPGKKAEFWSE